MDRVQRADDGGVGAGEWGGCGRACGLFFVIRIIVRLAKRAVRGSGTCPRPVWITALTTPGSAHLPGCTSVFIQIVFG